MNNSFSNFFGDFYEGFPLIEGAFQDELDKSLAPRGSEMLFDIVGRLGLGPGASAVDLGCGEGRQAIRLAEDFGFSVTEIDPVARHIEVSNEELGHAAERDPGLTERVRFELGSAQAIPLGDACVDLIWCREVLVHVEALEEAFAECLRILRTGGRMLVYQMFATDRLEPGEAQRMWGTPVLPPGWEARQVEAAFTRAGLEIDELIEVGSEWGSAIKKIAVRAAGGWSTSRGCCGIRSGTSRSLGGRTTTSCSAIVCGTCTE